MTPELLIVFMKDPILCKALHNAACSNVFLIFRSDYDLKRKQVTKNDIKKARYLLSQTL